MIFEFEATGKNIEKAIENALFELKAPREDVDIKILEQGGLFKKARVLVSISEDARDKYIKREEIKKSEEVENETTFENILEEVEDIKDIVEETVEVISDEIKKEIEQIEKVSEFKKIDAESFVKGLVKVTNCGEDVVVTQNDEEIKLEIVGKNATNLIGFRGECMNAIQTIASTIANENSDKKIRVILDIENYRARREESLKALANRMYQKIKKTSKQIKLEPMSANDRRIIHTELSKFEDIDTISKGTEPNRYILILPAGSEEEN